MTADAGEFLPSRLTALMGMLTTNKLTTPWREPILQTVQAFHNETDSTENWFREKSESLSFYLGLAAHVKSYRPTVYLKRIGLLLSTTKQFFGVGI